MNCEGMKLVPQKYSGVVLAVEKDVAEVELKLDCGSECNGCRLSAACGKGAGSVVVVRAIIAGKAPGPGEEVELTARQGSATEATVKLLMFPLAVFILIAVFVTASGYGDLIAGISALAGLLISFFIIYMRQRRAKPIWTIEENQI